MQNAIFLIESGKPLEMVKAYIADYIRIREENRVLADELGVEHIYTNRITEALTGVVFHGDVHPDFNKPQKRTRGRASVSYPKKGTPWAVRLGKLQGTKNAASWLADEFGIPCALSYSSADGGHGTCRIGNPLKECGFLFLSQEGPYVLWAPDVPEIVKSMAERGSTVTGDAATFQFNIPGARRILAEEWDLMVAEHKLKTAQAARS